MAGKTQGGVKMPISLPQIAVRIVEKQRRKPAPPPKPKRPGK